LLLTDDTIAGTMLSRFYNMGVIGRAQDLRLELLHGTLDLLILRTLASGERHGWSISERIQQISRGRLQVNQGSLYPALHRLERRKWLRAEWRTSEFGRRAKYYQLTEAGRRQLEAETGMWLEAVAAIGWVLEEG